MSIDNKNDSGSNEAPEKGSGKVLPFVKKGESPDKVKEIKDSFLDSLKNGFESDPYGLHIMGSSQYPNLCPPGWEGLNSEQIDRLLLRKFLQENGEPNARKFDEWATANHLAQGILDDAEIRKLTRREVIGTESLFGKGIHFRKVDDKFLFGQLRRFSSSGEERRLYPFDALACAKEMGRRYTEIVDKIRSGESSS